MGNCLAASARIGSSQNILPSYSGSSASDGLRTPQTEGEILSSPNLKAFMFDELRNATRNFPPDGLVGEGRFGCVYKGWIDQQTLAAARRGSSMAVAVKMLEPNSFEGHREWLTEVNYLGQLHHPNLVKLVGYCLEDEKLLLVYEFMPKGSLEDHLFRRCSQPLSWDVRLKIAIGAARGLSFLHHTQVIYRYFKASNILLDPDFNPKLSDFGLAKDGPTGSKSHVSTQALGSPSHAAPEYITTGRLSSKSDVYSFGVFLLELLSGRPSIDRNKVGIEQNLVEWARSHLGNKGKLRGIMDTRFERRYPRKAARKVAFLALRCLHFEAKARPRMSEVLAELEQLPM